MNKVVKTAIKALLAIAVSVLAFWWAFHDVDLEYVGANLGRTKISSVVLYILIQLAIHAARTARYHMLVSPLRTPSGGKISWRATFAAMSIGIPAAVFLPLRLGELVRPLLITRAGAPIAGAFSTVVVERIADGLFNVGLFFILLGMLPADASIPPELRSGAFVMLIFFGGGLAFLAAAYFMRERVLGLLSKILGRISAGFATKIIALLSTFLDGLSALGTPLRVTTFFALTALYWGANGFSTYLLINGYGLDLPVLSGNFAIACVVFAVTVPSGPAFAGTMEMGFKLGLSPFGVSASDSAVVAIVAHVLTLSILAFFAGVGFLSAEPSQKKRAEPRA
jgi:uncharacterized protein (TIRG00374 family)